MKVGEFLQVIQDDVVLYRQVGFLEFEDLFKGRKELIAKELLKLDVKCLGALDKRILDIEVM